MHCIDLVNQFQREIEVLELNEHYMIYAIDQKTEEKDLCSIETIDFITNDIRRHITLDYTRLYESFRTFSQRPDFFYAVNVLADYRLRLRKINKKSWNIEMDVLIQPEGEIINVFSLNEDYMIIYDEVKAEPDILNKYNISGDGHRYVNVRYLYEIKTGKKYPITDDYFNSLTDELPVCCILEEDTLVFEAFERTLLIVSVDSFIAHIKADGCAGFKVIAKCDDHFNYLHRIAADENRVVFRQGNFESGHEQIVAISFSHEEHMNKEILFDYIVPKNGEVFYDYSKFKVYHCPDDEEASIKHINCLNDPSLHWSYDGKFGSFAFATDNDTFVTTYYEEVFLKEYEYHEYAAIHSAQGIDTFEGKCEGVNDTIVKMRSFLAL